MNNVQGAIFDIDGTLLNSNDAHAKAYQQALEKAGYTFRYPQIRRLIGMGSDNLLPTLTGISSDSDEGKRISEWKVETKSTSTDAENSKPEPDIILAALKQLNLPAQQTIMIGDTPYDMEAARKSGVPAIALRSGGWTDADLKGAFLIYQNPEDLLNHLNDTPFFQTQAAG